MVEKVIYANRCFTIYFKTGEESEPLDTRYDAIEYLIEVYYEGDASFLSISLCIRQILDLHTVPLSFFVDASGTCHYVWFPPKLFKDISISENILNDLNLFLQEKLDQGMSFETCRCSSCFHPHAHFMLGQGKILTPFATQYDADNFIVNYFSGFLEDQEILEIRRKIFCSDLLESVRCH